MKKKIIALCLLVALVATAVVSGTLAYFTDEDENNNVFTMDGSTVDITLDEAKVNKDGDEWEATDDRVHGNTYKNVYPGAVLPKDPTVHNEGTMDAYVRAHVTINFNKLAGLTADKELFDEENKDAELLAILDIDTDNWTFVGYEVDSDARTVTYTYNYNTALAAGGSATLFTKATIPTTLTQEDKAAYGLQTLNIDITADAIQAVTFGDVEEAFAAYDAE